MNRRPELLRSFATPIDFQMRRMVRNAGGHRFRDTPRVGPPLNVICFVAAMITIPLLYKTW